ncbi:MAG: hypothetical protein DSM107014_16580 [Gomphosphaeria aponina SAG 52.96 = DSM 107014]|uniref:Uncharacterized protein n=1 Tax=Gomphosphaeria aponina SAG 52.96 = DSM 107014 TaxID=1521640 RepID=A0A941GWU1_9CHRO|nr:hypothetical protein [Gomphosphaeria aponina SAG 52.96 = DSM 107014]
MVKKHPNKDIREAISKAVEMGWKVKEASSHAHSWGQILCPYRDAECRGGEYCIISIWSTPRNPKNHAKQIKRVVDNCIHTLQEE